MAPKKIIMDLDKIESQIRRLNNLLASEFGKKAPHHVIEKEKEKLFAYQQAAKKLKKQMGLR